MNKAILIALDNGNPTERKAAEAVKNIIHLATINVLHKQTIRQMFNELGATLAQLDRRQYLSIRDLRDDAIRELGGIDLAGGRDFYKKISATFKIKDRDTITEIFIKQQTNMSEDKLMYCWDLRAAAESGMAYQPYREPIKGVDF